MDPHQISATPAPPKRRPGRPKNDITALLGQTFNRLTILSEAPRRGAFDRNRRVVVECSCGKTAPFAVRLADIQSGHVTSCGCRQRETFNDFQDGHAAKLDPKIVRKVFRTAAVVGRNDALTAAKCGVHRYAVRAICRLHKVRLIAKFGEAFRTDRKPDFGPRETKPSLLERRWLRKAVEYIRPITEPIVVAWNDLDENLQAAIACWSGVPSLQLAVA